MLDAPVSGGQPRAVAGTLTIMVGGDEGVFNGCQHIFEAMGENILYCGRNGNGGVTKVVNNLLGAIQAIVSAEVLSMGIRAGVDMKTLTDVISVSSGTFILLAGSVWMIPVPEKPNDMGMITKYFRLSEWRYTQFNLHLFVEVNG